MPGFEQPFQAFMSSSLQISPGIEKENRPINGHELNSSFKWLINQTYYFIPILIFIILN